MDSIPGTLEKVTAFILRRTRSGPELLLFRHPYAGIQLPAGTVEPHESPEQAAVREAAEETGLRAIRISRKLGEKRYPLPEDRRAVLAETRVYARPDPRSFDWAFLRRGAVVSLLGRAQSGYTHVSYTEWDRFPNPSYISMQITGWVPEHVLAAGLLRHFFLLEAQDDTPPEWSNPADWHVFTLFWSPLDALPELVEPQVEWLHFLKTGGDQE